MGLFGSKTFVVKVPMELSYQWFQLLLICLSSCYAFLNTYILHLCVSTIPQIRSPIYETRNCILLFSTRYYHVRVQRCYPTCKLTAWHSFMNPWRQKNLRTEKRTVIVRAGNISFMFPLPWLGLLPKSHRGDVDVERTCKNSGFVFQLNNLEFRKL